MTEMSKTPVLNTILFGTPFEMDGPVLAAVAIFCVVLSVIGMASCACENVPTTDNLLPASDLYPLVERSTHAWLAPRVAMDDMQGDKFMRAGWQWYTQLADLEAWFLMEMPQPMWDIRRLIASIKTSELYSSDPPSDSELSRMIILAMEDYRHE